MDAVTDIRIDRCELKLADAGDPIARGASGRARNPGELPHAWSDRHADHEPDLVSGDGSQVNILDHGGGGDVLDAV